MKKIEARKQGLFYLYHQETLKQKNMVNLGIKIPGPDRPKPRVCVLRAGEQQVYDQWGTGHLGCPVRWPDCRQ